MSHKVIKQGSKSARNLGGPVGEQIFLSQIYAAKGKRRSRNYLPFAPGPGNVYNVLPGSYPEDTRELLSGVQPTSILCCSFHLKTVIKLKKTKSLLKILTWIPDMGNVYFRSSQENVFFDKTTVI